MKCDSDLLYTLVQQSDEPSVESEVIAEHLESCSRCREELSQLGGDVSWWQDAQQFLSGDSEGELTNEDPLPSLPPVDLSFLDPPSHPEMLGRIGRYDVEGLIGRGGMGVVMRAHDSDLCRSVAIKVLAPEWAASVPARQRFAREAQAAASVAHENVIPIYNVESSAALPFLVMRYVPGMTLQRWVETHGALDTATILRVAGQLAEGLAAAHRRGLVHRDIKPGNVLVGENIQRVWITDFGLARAADSVTLTQTGVIAGTPHYMSPEQARGQALDQRSDLFSLGGLLFFLSTGRAPFSADNTLAVLHRIVSERAESLASLRDDLPPSFVGLVQQLLQRNPDRRPQDCDSVLKSIVAAQHEHQQGKSAKPPMSPRWKAVLTGAAVTAVLLIVMWRFPGVRSNSEPTVPASPSNPWTTVADSNPPVSPYLAKATEQIDQTTYVDVEQHSRNLVRMQRQIDQMLRTPNSALSATLDFHDDHWEQDVAEINALINQMNQN